MTTTHNRSLTTVVAVTETFGSQTEAKAIAETYSSLEDLAFFPKPELYGIQARLISAKPVELDEPEHPAYDFGIQVTVELKGQKAKREQWCRQLEENLESLV
jgi:hypothetical protein